MGVRAGPRDLDLAYQVRAASNLQMPDPPATRQAREVDAIADFMLAKIVGKGPMNRAKCIDYWGSDVEACSDLAK